jgi:phage N-6-adenine-methyltransferase
MNTAVLFSSKKDDWETPPGLYAELDREFHFDMDVAADHTNTLCILHLNEDMDALNSDWDAGFEGRSTVCWCNPPYSRGLQKLFIAKAAEEARKGVTVVMLLPARTDTKAFHAHIWDCRQHRPRPWVKEVRFLPGRLKFVGAKDAAPFPSMIVVFKV